MAVPVLESYSTGNTAGVSSTNVSIDIPTGVTSGDLLVVVVGNNGANTSPNWNTLSGFSQVQNIGSNNDDTKMALYLRKATGAESTTLTVETADTSARRNYGWYMRISGASTALNAIGSTDQDGGTSQFQAGITTTVSDCLVFTAFAYDGGDAGTVSPSWTGWSSSTDLFSIVTAGTGALDAEGWIVAQPVASTGTLANCLVTYAVGDGGSHMMFAVAPSTGLGAASGNGSLSSTVASISGSGDVTSLGNGSLASAVATISGSGRIVPTAESGNGSLVSEAAAITGSGDVIIYGSGALVSGDASISGSGVGGTSVSAAVLKKFVYDRRHGLTARKRT